MLKIRGVDRHGEGKINIHGADTHGEDILEIRGVDKRHCSVDTDTLQKYDS